MKETDREKDLQREAKSSIGKQRQTDTEKGKSNNQKREIHTK